MKVYVAISQIQSRLDADNVIAHLGDLYGKIPPEVEGIVTVGYIRALAREKGIKHITLNREECKITFHDNTKPPVKVPANVVKLLDFLENKLHTTI